jgi:threonine/homoserine/homoserine lactone efflux protein
MFQTENFYLFLTASILVNLSPGPDMLYTAARSLSQGSKAGIFSSLGIFTGCLIHITAATVGLSAIIAQSAFWFGLIKYAGAGYLVFLGIKSIFVKTETTAELASLSFLPYKKIFLQGMITNLLNPKVAIFFLSFLPPFVNPVSLDIKGQIIFLGLWFGVQGTLILMAVALLTGYFSRILKRNKNFWKWQEKLTGLILAGLGIRMLFVKK